MRPSDDPYAARHLYFDLAGWPGSYWRIFTGLFIVEIAWALTGSYLVPWPEYDTGTAWRTFAVHLAFLSLVIPTALVTRHLQNRNPVGLLGQPGTAWIDFKRVTRALLILLAVLYALPFGDWEGVTQARPALTWGVMLPFGALAVLIQTGAEELLYRGYLQQSLGAKSDNRLVWMGVPALLFGISHYNPDISAEATFTHILWATAFGLAAADLTARTGSLGASIGLHFTYNLPLVVLFAVPGELSGFTLFHVDGNWADDPHLEISLIFDLFYLWMNWMVCRIAIRR